MSALATDKNSYSAHLALAAGVAVSITAPTLADLQAVVARLQPPANDGASAAAAAQTPAPAPKPAKPDAKEPAAGNGAASTSPAASAQAAASGSASAPAGEKHMPYDEVKARVLALTKVSRETCVGALRKFEVDHATKLKPEQYAAFVAHADELLKAAK